MCLEGGGGEQSVWSVSSPPPQRRELCARAHTTPAFLGRARVSQECVRRFSAHLPHREQFGNRSLKSLLEEPPRAKLVEVTTVTSGWGFSKLKPNPLNSGGKKSFVNEFLGCQSPFTRGNLALYI